MKKTSASRSLALLLALASTTAGAQAVSGSWYNPAQSGHGLAIDQLAANAALMLWFAYDAAGRPMPLYAEGQRQGSEFIGPAYMPFGPRFGDWDPDELQFEPWGQLAFRADDCETGELRWSSGAFGSGNTPMRLLAYTAGTACPHVAHPHSGLGGLAGTWYHPQLQGASVNLQVIDDGSALAYWYTYDAGGLPKPLYVQGRFTGRRLTGDALAPDGMRFGSFRREDLRVDDFGEVSIDFHDCNHATLGYDTPLGRGSLPLVRLTQLQDVPCTLPAGKRADLPRHVAGTHDLVLGSAPASAIVTARDEMLLWMDGKVRRGFFEPVPGTGSARVAFDDGVSANFFNATADFIGGYVGGGVTGREVGMHAVEVVTAGLSQALIGGWGVAPTSPIVQLGENVTFSPDGSVVYRSDSLRPIANGRLGRVDETQGTFDFDLRFVPERGGHRLIGTGRLRRLPDNAMQLELFAAGPGGASLYKTLPRL